MQSTRSGPFSSRKVPLLLLFLLATLFLLFRVLYSFITFSPAFPPTLSVGEYLPDPPPGPLPPLDRLLQELHLHPSHVPSSEEQVKTTTPESHNAIQISKLHRCLEEGTCGNKQRMVILLGAIDFGGAFFENWIGGEAIWAASVIRAIEHLGYTFLFSASLEQTELQYRLLGDYVKVVTLTGADSFTCLSTPSCTRGAEHPNQSPWDKGGIPAWKIFSFHFWSDPLNPLGPGWTLAPEPSIELQEDYFKKLAEAGYFNSRRHGGAKRRLGSEGGLEEAAVLAGTRKVLGRAEEELEVGTLGNTYIGYSLEEVCEKIPFVRSSEKEWMAYVFAKHSWYFANDQFAWSPEIFQAAQTTLNITLLTYLQPTPEVAPPPEALTVIPHLLPQHEFYTQVSASRMMIGVGDPPLSPSPYDALCLGVPFLNPILQWDEEKKQDRTRWYTQQNGLKYIDPPYVYNVFRNDTDGFVKAVKSALENPIDRYIPDHMKKEALWARVEDWVEGDWKRRARTLLEKRQREGEGLTFVL